MAKSTVTYDNLTKEQQRCYNLIISLGVYELRSLARIFGDTSPTTSKRNDHIKVIMDMIISGQDLKPIPLRQGRPYKELSTIEGILQELSNITGKDYTLKEDKVKLPKHIKNFEFKQMENDIIKKKMFPIKFRGIVIDHIKSDMFVLNLDNNLPILIPRDIYGNLLKEYDYVTGSAIVMNNEKDYIIDSVDTINFTEKDKYTPKDIEEPNITPYQEIEVLGNKIKLGTRYIVNMEKFSNSPEKIKQLVNILKKNNIITIALIPNALFEEINVVYSIGFNSLFTIPFNSSTAEYTSKTKMFIEHLKRLQSQGLNIAVFVQDIVTIANNLDANFKAPSKFTLNHTDETTALIKDLVMLAKCTKSANTTFFTTYDEVDNQDTLYTSCIYKVSNKLQF